MANNLKIYADTSIFGGVFDDEFSDASKRFFELVRNQKINLLISPIVEDEIEKAPKQVKDLYYEMLFFVEQIPVSQKVIDLQQAYIIENILTDKWSEDALHVALATIGNCDIIVSWNFKHIVNYKKIPLFNAVNILKGYKNLNIYSPLEIINDEI